MHKFLNLPKSSKFSVIKVDQRDSILDRSMAVVRNLQWSKALDDKSIAFFASALFMTSTKAITADPSSISLVVAAGSKTCKDSRWKVTEGVRSNDGSLRLMDVVRLELNRMDVASNVNPNSACFNVSDFIFGINNMGRGLVVRFTSTTSSALSWC